MKRPKFAIRLNHPNEFLRKVFDEGGNVVECLLEAFPLTDEDMERCVSFARDTREKLEEDMRKAEELRKQREARPPEDRPPKGDQHLYFKINPFEAFYNEGKKESPVSIEEAQYMVYISSSSSSNRLKKIWDSKLKQMLYAGYYWKFIPPMPNMPENVIGLTTDEAFHRVGYVFRKIAKRTQINDFIN